MAIANLHETLLMYTLRKNNLNLDIMNYQSQKNLALAGQADLQSLREAAKGDVRERFQLLYADDAELQELYRDYTEIPDFEEEINKVVAQFEDELAELTAWETQLDTQITTADAELKEIDAYKQSIQQMLQANIQEDFNFSEQ